MTRPGGAVGNSRNGTTPKTVGTEVGDIGLDQPRDRNGTFAPRLVPKGARRAGRPGRDDHQPVRRRDDGARHPAPPGRHAGHRAVPRDHLQRSPTRSLEEVKAWQPARWRRSTRSSTWTRWWSRSATARTCATRPPTSPSGSTWTGSSTCWGSGCRPPRARSSGPGCAPSCANRGVRDVLIVCCDGLTGFPEAIEATWPHATVQTCVVHLIRAAMRFVSYSDRKAVAAALRPIYTAADRGRRADRAGDLRRLRPGQEVPGHRRDLGERLGAVHPVPGVPARAAPGHLHHQRDRVAELPAPQDHQEPRPLPQRRRRDQAALAGHLNIEDKRARERAKENAGTTRTANARPPPGSSKAPSPKAGKPPSRELALVYPDRINPHL